MEYLKDKWENKNLRKIINIASFINSNLLYMAVADLCILFKKEKLGEEEFKLLILRSSKKKLFQPVLSFLFCETNFVFSQNPSFN